MGAGATAMTNERSTSSMPQIIEYADDRHTDLPWLLIWRAASVTTMIFVLLEGARLLSYLPLNFMSGTGGTMSAGWTLGSLLGIFAFVFVFLTSLYNLQPTSSRRVAFHAALWLLVFFKVLFLILTVIVTASTLPGPLGMPWIQIVPYLLQSALSHLSSMVLPLFVILALATR
jgi:hypothetical protein